jgi:hypothetical protein
VQLVSQILVDKYRDSELSQVSQIWICTNITASLLSLHIPFFQKRDGIYIYKVKCIDTFRPNYQVNFHQHDRKIHEQQDTIN